MGGAYAPLVKRVSGKMKRRSIMFAAVIAGLGFFSPTLHAEIPAQTVDTAVAHCINIVHQSPHSQVYPDYANKKFDAYYNQASGLVSTNALLNVDQEAFFIFQKCMAQQGMPLK